MCGPWALAVGRPKSDGLPPTSHDLQPNREGLQLTSGGLQLTSDGLQPKSYGLWQWTTRCHPSMLAEQSASESGCQPSFHSCPKKNGAAETRLNRVLFLRSTGPRTKVVCVCGLWPVNLALALHSVLAIARSGPFHPTGLRLGLGHFCRFGFG